MFLPGADNIMIGSQIPDVVERTLASAEVIFVSTSTIFTVLTGWRR